MKRLERVLKGTSIAIRVGIIAILLAIIPIGLHLHEIGVLTCWWETGIFWCEAHPFFSGVMISWLAAISSIFIVSYFAYWNRDKKEQYNEIFRQSEKWLRGITMAVLFYLAIHLASKAFWPIGIPKFGEPYAKLGFLNYISPQDIFLSSLVFFTIMLLFGIAPYIIDKYKNIALYLLIISGVLSILITLCIYFVPSNSITEPSLMDASSNGDWHLFAFIFVVSLILHLLSRKIVEIPKGIKDDYKDLFLVFCILPAIIVASLVLAGDELVKFQFPNVFGNIVVGLVLISGFATLMNIVTISFKQGAVKPWRNPILLRSTPASLAAISGFFILFFLLSPLLEIDILKTVLYFSVAINIIILLYGFLYEKLLRYHFTEWWRRDKPIAMIFSILLIAIVAAIDPNKSYLLLGWEIQHIKLFLIFMVLFIGVSLPLIIRLVRSLYNKLTIKPIREFCIDLRKILKQVKNPMYQGMVLVKADPASLKDVVKGLDGMEGVYQTMVVRGEYDVCLIIEGLDYYEIEKKISEIRKIDGVADTTTLRDIREFFDREVR